MSTRGAAMDPDAAVSDQIWQPERALDGFGDVGKTPATMPQSRAALAERAFGPDLSPGVYSSAAGTLALNLTMQRRQALRRGVACDVYR